jgi:hypothetical protein
MQTLNQIGWSVKKAIFIVFISHLAGLAIGLFIAKLLR